MATQLPKTDTTQVVELTRVKHHKEIPYPHQQEAVESVLQVFKNFDRAHLVMACGTGKTRVGLWVAEKLKANRIVVFFPSLALIHQTLHEWLKNTEWPTVSYLVVCSDNTVTHGIEEEALDLEQHPYPVTTTATEIHEFLKRKRVGTTIVFCTYQSSIMLAAGIKSCAPFDLGIFDEAHRTTGIDGREFSIGLSDVHIPIQKRFFVTATPRHFSLHGKAGGEARLVYSMDSESIYGPRAYTLSFREAINRNLITDYKVIISTVLYKSKSKQSETWEWDQKAVALEKAIRVTKANRVITFHRSIQDAEQFVENIQIKKHLPKFMTTHINSFMPVNKRTEKLNFFKKNKSSLISNARCLTEGTNVPSVDMVAFLNPKHSKIDIIQAIGRALRKSGNKEKGYIFVPLFVAIKKGETIEEAIDRTYYGDIWDVLQALSEQDEDLHATIKYLKEQKGKTGKILTDLLNKYVEILSSEPDTKLKVRLHHAIRVSIIDKLGSNWDEMYGKLLAFREQYGYCNVPRDFKDKPLIYWIDEQRTNFREKTLSKTRITQLNSLGFEWDPIENQWMTMFNKLQAHKNQYGTCKMLPNHANDQILMSWGQRQRQSFKNNTLSQDKINKLDSLGFEWDPIENQWITMFNKLQAYKKQYGTCNIQHRNPDDISLSRWVATQRMNFKKNNLSQDKINQLNSLGVEWNPIESQWIASFNKVVTYKKKYGDCIVSRHFKDKKLGGWVHIQRENFKKNILSKEKIDQLNSLGFEWNPIKNQWITSFNRLAAYKGKFGHCNVPIGYVKDKQLATWVSAQRQRF